MEQIIGLFGYWAVLAGTLFEGETVAVLAGFAAHQGLLRLDLVMLCAFAGSFAGDQIWFWMGRRYGRRWLDKHPDRAAATERVGRLLHRWGDVFVLSSRFLYGLRTVGPIAIGLSSISPLRFAVLNLIAAAVWAVTMGAVGYVFGQAIESVAGELKAWEHRILAAVGIALGLYTLHRLVRARQKQKGAPEGASHSNEVLTPVSEVGLLPTEVRASSFGGGLARKRTKRQQSRRRQRPVPR